PQDAQVPRRLLLYTASSAPTGHTDGLALGCWRAGETLLPPLRVFHSAAGGAASGRATRRHHRRASDGGAPPSGHLEVFLHPSAVDGLLVMDFLEQFIVALDRAAQQM